MKIQIQKGTFDILPYGTDDLWRLSSLWHYVEEVVRKAASEYGYKEIRTPIYESTELFNRSVGESSDIVTKEMFSFLDKGGRPISLRPEGTASVMRSFVENHLSNLGSSHKFFYIGPMFRYERPQSGRYRQHHQFGVEAIGASLPEQDVEVIDLLFQIYTRLGLKHLKVHLNSVGDIESRNNFKSALLDYLRPHLGHLSADSQTRFEKNPLRILDSKDPKDKEIVQKAPSILNYLTEDCTHHFKEVCRLLEAIHIPFQINDKIVRGLDYYNKTVFEVISEDLGSQNTLGAGGRYDGLIASFDGPDLPGVGFATGLERVLQVMIAQNLSPPQQSLAKIYFIPLGEEARTQAFSLATQCRHAQICAEIELNTKKIQTALQNASKKEATHSVIIGTEELAKGMVQLKNLKTRDTQEVLSNQLISLLKAFNG